MNAEEYQLLNEFISELLGIHFPREKQHLLESRLRQRLRALHLRSYMDYYLLLQYDREAEIDHLTHAITNNETYFFREVRQFESLFEEALDDLGREAVVPGRLRMLCAGCSSGEEPYTLRIYSDEHGSRSAAGGFEIDAFDIDGERLAVATRAEYGPGSLRSTSEEQIQRYFTRSGSDLFRLLPRLREGVSFARANILDRRSFPGATPYDVIFCRNVLIYFSEPALHRAIDNFAETLRPGGLLFLGHSESIIGLTPAFETVRFNRCIAYRKTAT